MEQEYKYILVSNATMAQIKENKDKSRYKERHDHLLRLCNRYIWETHENALSSESGDNGQFSNKILHLALAYLLTGQERYANEAKHEMYHMLECLVGTKYILTRSVDEYAAHAACTIGISYNWLHDILTDNEKSIIVKNLVLKIIEVYYNGITSKDSDRYTRCSVKNLVINSGIGIAALSISKEWDAAERVYRLCNESISSNFLSMIHEDGGFEYGINRWRYCMAYILLFANAKLSLRDAEEGILSRIETAGYYPFYAAPSGLPFGIGDDNYRMMKKYDYTNWIYYNLTSITGNNDYARYRNRYIEPDCLELLWNTDVAINDSKNKSLPSTKIYTSSGIGIVSSDIEDIDQIAVSVKSGSNSIEYSHRDLNSIVVRAYGQRLITDPGGSLTIKKEHSYYASTYAHNTIIINDMGQNSCTGKIIREEEYDGCTIISAEASNAYGDVVCAYIRNIIIVDRHTIILIDKLELNSNANVKWQFHTFGEVVVLPQHEEIYQKGVTLRIAAERHKFTAKKQSNILPPTLDCQYTRNETTLYYEKNITEKSTIFACVMHPYRSNDNIPDISIKSGEGKVEVIIAQEKKTSSIIYDTVTERILRSW